MSKVEDLVYIIGYLVFYGCTAFVLYMFFRGALHFYERYIWNMRKIRKKYLLW